MVLESRSTEQGRKEKKITDNTASSECIVDSIVVLDISDFEDVISQEQIYNIIPCSY